MGRKIDLKKFKRKPNDKDTAFIKLIVWIIFIGILFIVVKISSIIGE